MRISWSLAAGILAAASAQNLVGASTVTPAEWLRQQTPPVFKPGHTLPRLGQMHCINPPVELRAELARNWGFAVRLSRPHGEPELLRLCAENPRVFQPAAMIGNLANLEGDRSRNWPEGTFLRKADGTLVDGRPIFSPEMPDAAWRMVIGEAIRQVDGQRGNLPAEAVATIENWTEHGLTVPIHMAAHGAQDPRVVAARGERSWQEYTSERKAHYEKQLAAELKRRYPNALHTAYTYSGFVGKPAGDWAWDYRHLKATTDLPSPECYYNYFNTGFVGPKDMLTLRLLWRHSEVQEGSPHYLGWVCAGYERNISTYQGDPGQGMYADLPRWMGYLKMSYLAGMLGGITTGEFGCEVRYDAFDPAQPPRWLDQMPVLSHAHALFTWLETDLRGSDLLPGTIPHTWNKAHPAYEFPTGHPHARVLVRKNREANRWSVGAWAADGVERIVTVLVPELGEYAITARPEGTVHLVELNAQERSVQWLDEAGMAPSLLVSKMNLGGHDRADQTRTVRVAGLEVRALGKQYKADPLRVTIQQTHANTGGNTSVRNTDQPNLDWKTQGYFQRNRDLGQVFTAEQDGRLTAIVLRTGPDTGAVLSGAPTAKVFMQFFEVTGSPNIHDNGTPPGAEARHGFSKNHRCDDYLTGVEYRPLLLVTGGAFPNLPPTRDEEGKPNGDTQGSMVYLRWSFSGDSRLRMKAGQRYAFMVGFEEPGRERGFTLANANAAGVDAPPSLKDAHDRYHAGWGLRREGDGTLPPTMFPGLQPPDDITRLALLRKEALFQENLRFALAPTTDGFPDVDTYRDLEFYLETEPETRQAPTTAQTPTPAPTTARWRPQTTVWNAQKLEPGDWGFSRPGFPGGLYIHGITRPAGEKITNPVIYDNDVYDDVFDDELAYVMASEGEMNLVGLIVTPVLTDGWGFSKPDWIRTAHDSRRNAELSGLNMRRIPPITVGTEAESEKAGENKLSEGARLYVRLINEHHQKEPDHPVIVNIGGQGATLASAYTLDPSIAQKCIVYYTDLRVYNGHYQWASKLVAANFRVVSWGDDNWWITKPGQNQWRVLPRPEQAEGKDNDANSGEWRQFTEMRVPLLDHMVRQFQTRGEYSQGPRKGDGYLDGTFLHAWLPGIFSGVALKEVRGGEVLHVTSFTPANEERVKVFANARLLNARAYQRASANEPAGNSAAAAPNRQ